MPALFLGRSRGPGVLAAAVALGAAGGCSLLVDLDGIRPGAADASAPPEDGGVPSDRLQVPIFFDAEAHEVLEGIGYPEAEFFVTPTGRLEIDHGVARPIPIAVTGLEPRDTVSIVVPDGFDPMLEICGVLANATTIELALADLAPCGISGGVAAVTLAVPIRDDAPAQEIVVEVRNGEGELEEMLTLAIRGLEVVRHVDDDPKTAADFENVVAAIAIDEQLKPDSPGPPLHLRATSAVRLAARIDVSGGPGSSACDPGCNGGIGGPGAAGDGGDGACSDPPCSGGGEGGGTGALLCQDPRAGGGGGHRTSGDEGGGTARCPGAPGGGSYGSEFLAEPSGGSGGGAGALGDPAPLTSRAGAGGGGGGALALDTAGRIAVGQSGRLIATGGAGSPGVEAGGGGGGGGGGWIRVRADSVVGEGPTPIDPAITGGPGGGLGGDGGRGHARIDAIGMEPPEDPDDNAPIFGPVFVTPLEPIVTSPALGVRVEARSAGVPVLNDTAVHIGVRPGGRGGFQTELVIEKQSVVLSTPLAPGLNEVCLLFADEAGDAITAPETLRRCAWVAYLPL
jgi:hypothetical protein